MADNLAGKRTRCPTCQAPLVVPVPRPPAVEEPLVDLETVEEGPATAYGLAAGLAH